MRRLAVLVLFLFMSVTAVAGSPLKRKGLILSFDELKALNPQRRVRYIRDLTEVIIRLEKAQTRYEVAENLEMEDIKDYASSLQKWITLLPYAQADEPPKGNLPVFDEEEFKRTGIGFKCLGDQLVFDQRVGTCLIQKQDKESVTRDFKGGDCPDQAIQIAGYDKLGNLCIPKDSWDNLSSARQTDLKNQKFLKQEGFAGVSKRDGEKWVGPVSEVRSNSKATAQAESATTPPAAICGMDKLSCKDLSNEQRKGLIAQFRKDKTDNICIYGGNFSQYSEKNRESKKWKKVKTCEPINYFPDKDHIVCERKQVVCNPSVFCLVGPDPEKSGSMTVRTFCEREGSKATELCKAKFESLQKESGNRVCDIDKDFTDARFKEFWTRTAKGVEDKYRKFCLGSESFQALFCSECESIGEQLLAMNSKVRPECNVTKSEAAPAGTSPAVREEPEPEGV